MGDKGVWDNVRQKSIAKMIGNDVQEGPEEEKAKKEAENLNIIKGKLSKDSFDELKSIGEEVLHPRAYTGNHGDTVELNELNDKQVKFLKDNKVFDFFRRS